MQYNMTVRKKDGNYQIIVSYKDGIKWKQKSKQGFVTQREAKLYGQKIIDELKKTVTNALDDSLKDITLIQFYQIYIREKINISANSVLIYNNIMEKYCKPLHDKRMRDITHSDIFTLISNLSKSAASKNLCIVLLRAVFNYAINPYRLIRNNPCAAIKRYRKQSTRSITTIPIEDMDMLLHNIEHSHPTYYLLCNIARYTGARYGEIIALQWSDIDFDNNTISISKQWAQCERNKYGFKLPKSKNSIRIIPIPPILSNLLKQHQCNGSDRLFPFRTSRSSQVNELIQRFLPGKSIHMFRHTYATTLLGNNVDIQTVASLLGDNINTVIKTYIHFSDEMRKNAADNVANIFG